MASVDGYYSSDGNLSAWDQQYWDAGDINDGEDIEDDGEESGDDKEEDAHDMSIRLYSAPATLNPFSGSSSYINALRLEISSEEGIRKLSKISEHGDNDSELVNVSDSSRFESGSSEFSDMKSGNSMKDKSNTEDNGREKEQGSFSPPEQVLGDSNEESDLSKPCKIDFGLSYLGISDFLCPLDFIGAGNRPDETVIPTTFLRKFGEKYDREARCVNPKNPNVIPGLRMLEKLKGHHLNNERTLPWWNERAEKQKESLRNYYEPFYEPEEDLTEINAPIPEPIDRVKYPSCAKNNWRRDPTQRALKLHPLTANGISNSDMTIPRIMDLSILSDLHLKAKTWYDWAEKKEAMETPSVISSTEEKRVVESDKKGKYDKPSSRSTEIEHKSLHGMSVSFLDWMETPCGRNHTPYGLATCKVCTYFTEYAKQSQTLDKRTGDFSAFAKDAQVDHSPAEYSRLEELLNSGSRAASRVHNAEVQEEFERAMRNLYSLHFMDCNLTKKWRKQSTSYNKARWGPVQAEETSQSSARGYETEALRTASLFGKRVTTKYMANGSSTNTDSRTQSRNLHYSEIFCSAVQASPDITDSGSTRHKPRPMRGKNIRQELSPVTPGMKRPDFAEGKTGPAKPLGQRANIAAQSLIAPEKASHILGKQSKIGQRGMSIEFPRVMMRFKPQELTKEQRMLLERMNECFKMREKLFEKLLLIEADKLNHPSDDAAQTRALLSRHLMAASPAALDSLICNFSGLCNRATQNVNSAEKTSSKNLEGRKADTGNPFVDKLGNVLGESPTGEMSMGSKGEKKGKIVSILGAHSGGILVPGGGGSRNKEDLTGDIGVDQQKHGRNVRLCEGIGGV